MQSEAVPRALHAAIIMDGNGRWATQRGLPRLAGHHRGVEAIRRTAEACPDLGIGTLTLYAFSADNWQRPAEEVGGLMRLLRSYLRNETQRLGRTGTRLSVVGRRDRLPAGIPEAIAAAEAATASGNRLHLRICVDYSARDAIIAAAQRLQSRRGPHAGEFRRGGGGRDARFAGRRRPADPHRRRAAAVGFHAVGGGLRRAALHRADVARFRSRRPRRRRWPSSPAASAGSAA